MKILQGFSLILEAGFIKGVHEQVIIFHNRPLDLTLNTSYTRADSLILTRRMQKKIS